jgi:hypothetical protein
MGSLTYEKMSQFVLSNCPSVLGSMGKIVVPFIFNSILGLTKTPKFLELKFFITKFLYFKK